jgi:hypothetical protein
VSRSHGLKNAKTVEAWHANVEKDKIEVTLGDLLDGVAAITAQGNGLTALS